MALFCTPFPLRRLVLTSAVLSILLFPPGSSLFAQQAPRAGAEPPAETGEQRPQLQYHEQINVRLVTLPILARDRSGRPVTDLKADELEIREGRQTYPVAALSPFYEAPRERHGLPNVRLVTEVPGGTVDRATSTVQEPRYLVVLADVENEPPTDRGRSLESLRQFLERELDASFRIALISYDGDLKLLVPFTQDREAVTAALQRLHAELRPRPRITHELRIEQLIQKLDTCEIEELTQQFDDQRTPSGRESRARRQIDRVCMRDSMHEYFGEVIPRATSFVRALGGVVEYAGGLEGHKAVMVVGGRIVLNPAREAAEAMRALFGAQEEITQLEQSLQSEELVRPELEKLMALAYQNDVSLSFVDRTPAPSDTSVKQHRHLEPGYRPQLAAFNAAQQDLDEIAAGTGGSFVAANRFDEGLRQSLNLMEGGYYLTFYVQDTAPITPRRLRGMTIRTSRGGIDVRHRRGFEGWRGSDPAGYEQMRGRIEVGQPVEKELDGVKGEFIPLRIVLDPRDLGYEETIGSATTQFTVHVRLQTPKGVLLTDSYRVLTHSYPLELWRSGTIEPPEIVAFAELPDGEYIAEALVSVPRKGRRGSIVLPLSVGRSADGDVAMTPADVAETTNIAAASTTIPLEPRRTVVRSPRGAVPPVERENRPTISFATHLLGVVSGVVDVGLIVAPEVATIELRLDDERIGILEGEPWTLPLDLGPAPSPRKVTAIARNQAGADLGRAVQWVNLPRPWAELDVVLLKDPSSDGLVAHVALESVGGERPVEMSATLNGTPLTISDPTRILLPPVDLTAMHFLRVEAKFERATPVSRELAFGGRYVEETSAELSSVAVRLQRDDLDLREVQIRAAGAEVPVVALEKGPADLIVVIDPRALRSLPGFSMNPSFRTVRMGQFLPPLDEDIHLRLLWPIQDDSGSGHSGYRLFPSSSPDAQAAGRGLLWHLASAQFPQTKGAVRLADAVAVAGPMAVANGRRRVVLLLHGGSRGESEQNAAAARAYLQQLHVPLVVWTTGRPTLALTEEWGEMDVVSTSTGLQDAWKKLMNELGRQRVLWLEGMYLPQTLELVGGNAKLAGTTIH